MQCIRTHLQAFISTTICSVITSNDAGAAVYNSTRIGGSLHEVQDAWLTSVDSTENSHVSNLERKLFVVRGL